jgi:hypothetical protein
MQSSLRLQLRKAMKTITSISMLAALAAAGFTSGALAQTPSPATATPSTEISATTPLPAPNEIVYVPRLPTPADITKGAQAKNVSVERISQTNSQVEVVYRTADGKMDTTSYRLLADAGNTGTTNTAVAVPSSPAPAVAVMGTTTPSTVVYTPAPATRVYYYPDYYYDYPGYWYPPVSFGIGLGYRRSYGYYGYHGYHGGYRVGYRGGFHGGGWHR